MGLIQLRGGAPAVSRPTVDTTGRLHRLPFETFWLKLRNKGANVVRVYFTLADFTGDTNYVELPVAAATHPYGEWEAPVELIPDQTVTAAQTTVEKGIWMKAIGGNSVIELVAFQRRG